MQITIRYGMDSFNKEYASAPTVGEIIDNHDLRLALGFGDNVRATINGIEQGREVRVGAGQTVSLETRANTKA